MGLRNLSFPVVTVPTAGGDLAVRGLTPKMVMGLYQRHRGDLTALFENFVAKSKGDEAPDISLSVVALMDAAPDVMAELIALASGDNPTMTHIDPDTETNPNGLTDWEMSIYMARDVLPLPVQIDALQKIFEQTFTSDMPPGKFLAVVIQMAGTTTAVLNPPTD